MNTLNIDRMLEAQRDLDARIYKEHDLEAAVLFQHKLVALIVELAEAANEARWFKYWSEDQTARTALYTFTGVQDYEFQTYADPRENEQIAEHFGFQSDYAVYVENPLLEEYADGLHFFLSLAIYKGWERALKHPTGAVRPKARTNSDLFLETIHFLTASRSNTDASLYNGMKRDEMTFHLAWLNFLELGTRNFGFTPEQIEAAYFKKNEKNHARQDSGY